MRYRWLVLLLLAVSWAVPVRATAGEVDVLLRKLVQRNVLSQADAQQIREEIRSEGKEMTGRSDASMDGLPRWVQTLQPFGSFRYRYDHIDKEPSVDRNRNRVNAKVGVKGKVNDTIDYVVRLASGSSDAPTNTNQTLTGAFSSKQVWLDWMYADWRPENVEGLSIVAGKQKNVFNGPAGTDLIWDTDVTPEGIVFNWKGGPSNLPNTTFYGKSGGFYLTERAADSDTSLWAVKGGFRQDFPNLDGAFLGLWGNYYDYGNIDAETPLNVIGNNNADGGGTVREDFDLAGGSLEIGFNAFDKPVSIHGELVENTATSAEETAHLVGIKIGTTKNKGDWMFGYNYRHVEADAIVAGLADADFMAGGGTDGEGHKVWGKYQLNKNWTAGITYFFGETDLADPTDYQNIHADLVYKWDVKGKAM